VDLICAKLEAQDEAQVKMSAQMELTMQALSKFMKDQTNLAQ
jgi:hypothetical protein